LGWSVGGGVPGMRRVEEMAMERVACGKAIPHVFAQKKTFRRKLVFLSFVFWFSQPTKFKICFKHA
jgi:hypothetical protein